MKVHLPKFEPTRQGGGWTWQRNFASGFELSNYEESDIYLIAGASMLTRDEVRKAKDDGKKIVLRVDNFLKNSRNRNTGMTRMKDFAEWSALIIYQSQWAQDFLSPFLGKKGVVILNSVDESVYNDKGRHQFEYPTYLYSRYNRDESKNWIVAQYWFQKIHQENPDAQLFIAGNFSPELIENDFDFYAGENVRYFGVLPAEMMAQIYKQSDFFMYPYFNDACSNTLIEALMCGCKLYSDEYLMQGSAKQIKTLFDSDPKYFYLDRMIQDYREALERL